MRTAFAKYWKNKDQKYVKEFDSILCDSINVRDRVKKFYGEEVYNKSVVVYPPIFTEKFKWVKQADFYLSTARLDKMKRVDTIIKAFQKMPDKKLVVISGGPEMELVKTLSKGYNNITIIGWVSEKDLLEYIGSCIATIYMPIDEDFGMSPVESQSAGKPCIGVNEGGLKETIVHNKTGYLCDNATEEELIKAVKYMTPKRALSMKRACILNSKKFSDKEFTKGIKDSIKRVLSKNSSLLSIHQKSS
jgi:glycosyltransferase involved in cell wall biosynthesis